jgi:hypothetical protein
MDKSKDKIMILNINENVPANIRLCINLLKFSQENVDICLTLLKKYETFPVKELSGQTVASFRNLLENINIFFRKFRAFTG